MSGSDRRVRDARAVARRIIMRAMAVGTLLVAAFGILLVSNTFGPIGPAEATPDFAPVWSRSVLSMTREYAVPCLFVALLLVISDRWGLRICATAVLLLGSVHAFFGLSMLTNDGVPYVAKPIANSLLGIAMLGTGLTALIAASASGTAKEPT